jgi:probable phosphomutase (TIGR03848 family)
MTTVLLIRHGRTAANATGVLAGWTPGVTLDDVGRAQAASLGERIAGLPLAAIITSPLERTVETARQLSSAHAQPPEILEDERLAEVRYGDWTGRDLKSLAKDPLWKVVQSHPSAVTFPGPDGEGMAQMASRAIASIRHWNETLGAESMYVAVSHGDVIKAIVADALGLHLDQFQRIHVDPCSLTVISYTRTRPFLIRLNDTGGSVEALLPKVKGRRPRRGSGDAVVGGGAGP